MSCSQGRLRGLLQYPSGTFTKNIRHRLDCHFVQGIQVRQSRRRTLYLTLASSGYERVASVTDGVLNEVPAPQQSSTIPVAASIPSRSTTFEFHPPDASVIAVQGLVLALTLATAAYWWLVVVPSERAALGRSKRLGPLNNYLQDLERPEAKQDRWLERWFYTDWLRQREVRRRQRPPLQQSPEAAVEDGSHAAEDPYDDLMQPEERNLLRPAASTPTPRFLSLDNPIVTTGALLLLAALLATLQQR